MVFIAIIKLFSTYISKPLHTGTNHFQIITTEMHVLQIICICHYKYLSCKYYYILQNKMTPLHWASERGHINTVATLLAHGGNVEAQDKVNEYNLN